MVMPKVFIIILNWNGKDDTLACLDSVRKLDYPDYRVIVVDNASTDGSVGAVKLCYPSASWLTIIENSANLGYTGGNNVGIRYAMEKGADYIWLLNNDTKSEPDALKRLIKVTHDYPKAGLLGPKIVQMDNPAMAYSMIGSLNMWFPWPDRMEGKESSLIKGGALESDFISGSAILVKREFVDKVGLLDERFFFYWEENDWCERGKKSGFKVILVPDAVVYHKGGGSSGKGWNEFTSYYLVRNWILFMRKHARARHWITFLPFLIFSLSYWILKVLLKKDVAVVRSFISAVSWNIRTPL
ncbi:MAG: glycosyltransferase family 2 protein [Nitrospirae bacterium]|nr:glycosyltransferase family 2 protein [Nitrospirota bacterium]